jgi:hypothetical protein
MSWTRVTHAVHPQISGSVPYLVALVRLVEGPLFVCGLDHDGDDTQLFDAAPVTIEIGLAAGGLRLPIARCVPRGPRAEAGPDRPGSP